MYHLQRNEGHIIPRIEMAWTEIGYFQIGDNPGRKEPGTGEVNWKNIFKFIHNKAKADNQPFFVWLNPTRMHIVTHLSPKYEAMRNPENGWSLYGLMQALEGRGLKEEAAAARARFEIAWKRADVQLRSSCFCQAGS